MLKRIVCLLVLSALLAACGADGGGQLTAEATAPPSTVQSDLAGTLQAEAEQEAAFAETAEPRLTPTPFPTLQPAAAVGGVQPADRIGACPQLDGFEIHTRQGFCIAAPEAWNVLNVDGGLASFLGTTPGQAISLVPDWADEPPVCELTVYIAPAQSALAHLTKRYEEFEARTDLDTLSPIEMTPVAGMGLPGFSWSVNNGRAGAIYADLLSPNRLVHISHSGTACPLESVEGVLGTLRFNL